MARTLRTLLVWLIMLTLPMQAVSASLMSLSMEMPSQASHVSMGADCHEQAGASEQDAPANPLVFKACSPCCVGPLIGAVALPQIYLPSGHARHDAMPEQDFKGYIPDSLDRPPKRIS
jgi:hypothetical protein